MCVCVCHPPFCCMRSIHAASSCVCFFRRFFFCKGCEKVQPAANIAKRSRRRNAPSRAAGALKLMTWGKNSAVLERESDGRRWNERRAEKKELNNGKWEHWGNQNESNYFIIYRKYCRSTHLKKTSKPNF